MIVFEEMGEELLVMVLVICDGYYNVFGYIVVCIFVIVIVVVDLCECVSIDIFFWLFFVVWDFSIEISIVQRFYQMVLVFSFFDGSLERVGYFLEVMIMWMNIIGKVVKRNMFIYFGKENRFVVCIEILNDILVVIVDYFVFCFLVSWFKWQDCRYNDDSVRGDVILEGLNYVMEMDVLVVWVDIFDDIVSVCIDDNEIGFELVGKFGGFMDLVNCVF